MFSESGVIIKSMKCPLPTSNSIMIWNKSRENCKIRNVFRSKPSYLIWNGQKQNVGHLMSLAHFKYNTWWRRWVGSWKNWASNFRGHILSLLVIWFLDFPIRHIFSTQFNISLVSNNSIYNYVPKRAIFRCIIYSCIHVMLIGCKMVGKDLVLLVIFKVGG